MAVQPLAARGHPDCCIHHASTPCVCQVEFTREMKALEARNRERERVRKLNAKRTAARSESQRSA